MNCVGPQRREIVDREFRSSTERDIPSDLGKFDAFGAVATVGQIAGHNRVAASGAEEPFSVGSGLHEFEVAILDAIRAADRTVGVALDSSHFDDEGVAFFVDRKTAVVDGGRPGSERLGADRATGGFGVHHYPLPPESDRKSSFRLRRLICMFRSGQMVYFFSCRSGRVNTLQCRSSR